ncbi:MAG TPA: hypothetical protein VM238_06675 [Phycisphaerae bacterium]|nr:hypothetical protein [Phycisphaerae bacterium]
MYPTASVPHGGRKARAKRLRSFSLAAIAGGLLLALAAPALADRVITKTGETYTGTIIEENEKEVVLKSISGKTTIPRDIIETIEKAGAEPTPTPGTDDKPEAADEPVPPKIEPIEVDPAKADDALKLARSALVAGNWLKAGGLLEGLLGLDQNTFKYDDRVRATGALITCYLQIKDAMGASKAIARRAQLAQDVNDKRRLLGAAEVLRNRRSVQMGGKTLSRFEEVLEVAMPVKAGDCLEEAKKYAKEAKRLNERAQLEKAADQALKMLGEANIFQPGYSGQHEQEVLAELVNNIFEAARATVAHCEKVRPELTRTRLQSAVSKPAAIQWNAVAKPYLDNRAMTEQALKHLKLFTLKYKVPDLYTNNDAEITHLLAELDEYQYYPKGTSYGYGYGYGYGYSTQRMKIQLRRF